MLRSTLDARFVLYHHVIRRRVEVELEARFADPLAAHIDARWRSGWAADALFVNDQFVTLVRRPARGKAGLAETLGKADGAGSGQRRRVEADPRDLRALKAAATGAGRVACSAYGARLLGDYDRRRAGRPTTSCSSC